MTAADTLVGHVDGLHDLAEKLEQTGIPASQVRVEIHTDHDGTNAGQRLADALGLDDRLDFEPGEFGADRAFTRWRGYFDGAQVVVFGTTPKENPR